MSIISGTQAMVAQVGPARRGRNTMGAKAALVAFGDVRAALRGGGVPEHVLEFVGSVR
ncbi:hypothetical protein SK571_33195 [Lentzea sp. BCCO 10_0798]|uniref:Uncharacterized protein n=1 Tax=Lentzea kristufekii TaxID=3095430 RepID=A0ABU4U1N9_9PSEU|nr:hypothetical protein [Lentzea sp. BCCO 10_0798]MDX8054253.1 hypothetical protein [Lentzea sp. BCCO 10_0798]